jgi:quercetin dioxygenase-like cupin family protein
VNDLAAGVTPAGGGVSWSIFGQTYYPKSESADCFCFEAVLPPRSGVPPHVHRAQDEYFYILAGVLEVEVAGEHSHARPGDLVRLPRGIPHAFKTPDDQAARMLAWVTPAGRLRALFEKLDNLANLEEAIRLSAQHEVDFMEPPP